MGGTLRSDRKSRKVKINLGSYAAAGQLQQRPSPAGGGIFKRHWFRFWQLPGANLPPVVVRPPDGTTDGDRSDRDSYHVDDQLQSWDCAFKGEETSDYVVGQVWARVGSLYILGDQVRDVWTFQRRSKQFVISRTSIRHFGQAGRRQGQRLGCRPDARSGDSGNHPSQS